MARLLSAGEINDFQSRQHIAGGQVQPWLKVVDSGRVILIYRKTDGSLQFSDISDLSQSQGLDQFGVNQQPDAGLLTWDPDTNTMVPSLPAIVQRSVQETGEQLAQMGSQVINYTAKTVTGVAEGVAKGAVEGAGSGTLVLIVGAAVVGFVAWKLHLL